MNHWMFNCEKVSRKLSDAMDRRLPLSHRLMIRFHLMMCRYCSRLKKQLTLLRHAMQTTEPPRPETDAAVALSPDARDRLKQLLQNAVKDSR